MSSAAAAAAAAAAAFQCRGVGGGTFNLDSYPSLHLNNEAVRFVVVDYVDIEHEKLCAAHCTCRNMRGLHKSIYLFR